MKMNCFKSFGKKQHLQEENEHLKVELNHIKSEYIL